MIKSYGQNDPKLISYFESTFRPEDEFLKAIRIRAEKQGLPAIHVGVGDGLHLEVLARAIGAKKAVEIGTLAGYSGVCLLRGMPPGGKLYTFEYEQKHADVAAISFAEAGLKEHVEIHVGAALEGLSKIEKDAPFDLVFIDADKVNYPNYLAWASRFLRRGGVILADNTFGFGMIADRSFEDPEDEAAILALRQFNEQVAQSGEFRATLLPTGEGLTMAVKL